MNFSRSNGLRIQAQIESAGGFLTPRFPAPGERGMCGAFAGRGEDDDVRTLDRNRRYALDEFVAVEARHHQIEQHEIDRPVALEFFEADRAILCELDREMHPLQHSLQQYANREIVIDHQDALAGTIDS